MARPSIWAHAYRTIPTLRSHVWVDGVILDFYLMSIWYSTRGRTHIRFVDITTATLSYNIHRIHQMPTQEEIRLFQKRYFIDPGSPAISQPVGFIAFHHQHYFTVVFDYDAALAYVLGRRISEDCEDFDEELDDWNTWMGPLYWARLGAFHGIDPGDANQVTVITHNWPQNGRDCGPIAAFLLKHFLDSGLGDSDGEICFPAIPCGHQLRLQMLGTIREACRKSWEDYNLLTASHLPDDDTWTTWDDTSFVAEEDLAAMENEASGQQYAPVVQDLNIACANCIVCQRERWADRSVEPNIFDGESNGDEEEEVEDAVDKQKNLHSESKTKTKTKRLRKLFQLHPDTKRARCRDWMPSGAVKGRLQEYNINQRKHVKNWSEGTMFRFPRPTPPMDLPAYTERRWLPFDRKFDDYEGAPTYESMKSYRNPYEFVVEPYYRQGIWSMFRDYGWRILPSFHQMFYLGDPVHVLDHVMVVGIPDGYDPAQQISNHIAGGHSNTLVM